MKTMTATDAKTRFGQMLDDAMRAPVVIEKSGRSVAVLVSSQEYQRLQDAEEEMWGFRARMAEANGFLDEAEQTAWLARMGAKLNAETPAN